MRKEKTDQPNHRPLREGEIIQEGDEYHWQGNTRYPVRVCIGQKYSKRGHAPIRRPAGKG